MFWTWTWMLDVRIGRTGLRSAFGHRKLEWKQWPKRNRVGRSLHTSQVLVFMKTSNVQSNLDNKFFPSHVDMPLAWAWFCWRLKSFFLFTVIVCSQYCSPGDLGLLSHSLEIHRLSYGLCFRCELNTSTKCQAFTRSVNFGNSTTLFHVDKTHFCHKCAEEEEEEEEKKSLWV